MKSIKRRFIGTFLTMLFLSAVTVSCSDSNEEEDKEDLIDASDTIKSAVVNIGGELFSVPSPIQTAMLIQKTGITYDKSVLNIANKVNTYATDFSKAMNLGVYGADLGYVSLYSQTQDALGYLASIKQLSDKLGLSAAFEGPLMERIQKNITNKDSMSTLVGLAYRASDAYLKDNQRMDVSTLILTGGWIESMHFATMAYKAKPNEAIRYRIAEQKQALMSILKIIRTNASEEAVKLTEQLNDLSKVYEQIQFNYKFAEPTTDTARKVTYINSTTEVVVTDEQITQICDKVAAIRTKIVNTTQS